MTDEEKPQLPLIRPGALEESVSVGDDGQVYCGPQYAPLRPWPRRTWWKVLRYWWWRLTGRRGPDPRDWLRTPCDRFEKSITIRHRVYEGDLQRDVEPVVEDLQLPARPLVAMPLIRPKKAHTAITRAQCGGCGEVMDEDQIPRRVDGRVIHSRCYTCLDARWEDGALKATLKIRREAGRGEPDDIEELVVHLVPPENLQEFVVLNKIRIADRSTAKSLLDQVMEQQCMFCGHRNDQCVCSGAGP